MYVSYLGFIIVLALLRQFSLSISFYVWFSSCRFFTSLPFEAYSSYRAQWQLNFKIWFSTLSVSEAKARTKFTTLKFPQYLLCKKLGRSKCLFFFFFLSFYSWSGCSGENDRELELNIFKLFQHIRPQFSEDKEHATLLILSVLVSSPWWVIRINFRWGPLSRTIGNKKLFLKLFKHLNVKFEGVDGTSLSSQWF